jgi:hypothetical protein
VKNYTLNSIEIIWTERTESFVTGYLISINPPDGGNHLQNYQPKEDYRYNFTDLTPGREYVMKVEIMGMSEEVTATQRTGTASLVCIFSMANFYLFIFQNFNKNTIIFHQYVSAMKAAF